MTHAEKTDLECEAGTRRYAAILAEAAGGQQNRHRCASAPGVVAAALRHRGWMAGHAGIGLGRWYPALRRLVPTECPLCGNRSHGAVLCAACDAAACASMRGGGPRCQICALRLDGRTACPDCRALPQSCARIVAAFDYAPPGDALVRGFKAGRRFLLAPALAATMAQSIRNSRLSLPAGTVLVPVPARSDSILQRGFSPAAELARFLALELALPCRAQWLVRVRDGKRQTHRSRRERLLAGQADFHCPVRLDGIAVMVVDDVLTTGTTLHCAAQSLRAAGAAQVWGAVLARTPWRAA